MYCITYADVNKTLVALLPAIIHDRSLASGISQRTLPSRVRKATDLQLPWLELRVARATAGIVCAEPGVKVTVRCPAAYPA